MNRILFLLSLFWGFSTLAATSLRVPILLEHNGRVKEVRELRDILKKASIAIPEAVELNLLQLPGEVLPEILNNVERLARKSGSQIILVTDASLSTFTSTRLKQQLCYKGDAQMALRLLPHIGEYFFSYNTAWLGYRLPEQSEFRDFDGNIIDVQKVLDVTQAEKLRHDDSLKNIQIITKDTSENSKVRLDSVLACP